MKFYNRGILSISRSMGKTIIFFLLVLILGSVISATILVNQAIDNTERNLRASLPTVATTEVDFEIWDRLNNEMADDEWPSWNLRSDEIRQIGALPQVRSFDFTSQAWGIFIPDVTPYEPVSEDDSGDDWEVEIWPPIGGDNEFGMEWRIRGVENPNILDMEEGLIELAGGRTFTESETANLSQVVLISEAVANLNGITIGDTINLRNIIFNWMEATGEDGITPIFGEETYTVEVIGTFRPIVSLETWGIMDEMENRIYAANTLVEQIMTFQIEQQNEMWGDGGRGDTEVDMEEMLNFQPLFTLYDMEDMPAFRESFAQLAPEQFVLIDAGRGFADVSAAFTSMDQMTSTILWITIGAAILILSLLITLFIRDRKYEIGIYMTLGERKGNVIGQVILEVLSISVVAIAAALFVGMLVSMLISDNMLMNDLMAAAENGGASAGWGSPWGNDPLASMGFTTEMTVEDILASYRVTLSPSAILLFAGVGLGTALVATIAPIVYIVRLNPKKIMM